MAVEREGGPSVNPAWAWPPPMQFPWDVCTQRVTVGRGTICVQSGVTVGRGVICVRSGVTAGRGATSFECRAHSPWELLR